MKLATSLFVAAGIATAPALAAESYTIDTRHTFPVFEVMHLGFSTQRGRFNKVTGAIKLDRTAKKGSVDIAIDVASIDMGIEKWDEHMKSEDFFNVAKYPNITYKSDNVTFEGDKPASVQGQLTLLGVTKPVTLKLTHFNCGHNANAKKDVCGADATATIKRSDFGMKYALPHIGDDVVLRIPVEAFKD